MIPMIIPRKKRYDNNNKHSNNAIPSLKENKCLRETLFFEELNHSDDDQILFFIDFVYLNSIYRNTLKFLLKNKKSAKKRFLMARTKRNTLYCNTELLHLSFSLCP